MDIDSGLRCARHPVTAIKALGFLLRARRIIRSALRSLSAVTVHVFITYISHTLSKSRISIPSEYSASEIASLS